MWLDPVSHHALHLVFRPLRAQMAVGPLGEEAQVAATSIFGGGGGRVCSAAGLEKCQKDPETVGVTLFCCWTEIGRSLKVPCPLISPINVLLVASIQSPT